MEDSEPAEDGLLAGLRWNRSARDQAQLKHKIRDLPGLLKHGLHLRKKSVSISHTARVSFRVGGRSLHLDSCRTLCTRGRSVTSSRLRCFQVLLPASLSQWQPFQTGACLSVCLCVRNDMKRFMHHHTFTVL